MGDILVFEDDSRAICAGVNVTGSNGNDYIRACRTYTLMVLGIHWDTEASIHKISTAEIKQWVTFPSEMTLDEKDVDYIWTELTRGVKQILRINPEGVTVVGKPPCL